MTPKRIRPTSEFSQRFAAALRAIYEDAGVTQPAIREQMGNTRTQSFISERVRGIRPVDTDIIDAIAALVKMSPRDLVQRVLRAMGDEGGATVVRFPGPSDPPPTVSDADLYDEPSAAEPKRRDDGRGDERRS